MTAHEARTQHVLSSGLMKKFDVTAAYILETVIPTIRDAVELQAYLPLLKLVPYQRLDKHSVFPSFWLG